MITLTGICVPLFAMWCNIDIIYTLQPSRYPMHKKKVYLILTVWCTLGFLVPGLLFGEVAGQLALPFLGNIPIFATLLMIDAYRGWRYLFTYFTALMIPSSCVAFIVMMVVILGNEWIATPICAGLCLGISFLARRFIKPIFCKAQERNKRNWRTLTLVTIFVCALVYLLAYYPTPIMERPHDYMITVATVMALALCILVIVLELVHHTEERIQTETQAQQEQFQRRLMEEQYAYMEENQRQLKQLRHDMLHHTRIISEHLAQGQTNEAQDYLGRIGELIAAPDLGQFCVSRTANITITYFAREAARLGISFTCAADIPQEQPEHSTDLCAVLANALQNALEACQRTDKPEIRLTASRAGCALLLHVENSFDGKLVYGAGGQLVSRKAEDDHGYGLVGMRRTAERHAGYFKAYAQNQRFHLELALGDLFSE